MSLNLSTRTLFYLATTVIVVWFLYTVREILTPFILAMIFAYIFNPLINFFSQAFKLPRTIAIICVYVLLIVSVVYLTSFLTRSIIHEIENLRTNFSFFLEELKSEMYGLPPWLQPSFEYYIDYLSTTQFFATTNFSPFPFVTKAFAGFLQFIVFLFSAFFFLKDGKKMIEKITFIVPNKYKMDTNALLLKINLGLSDYLRGQMIIVMSTFFILLLAFNIIGIRYKVTLAVFSAILGIIPLFGWLVATVSGTFITLISGGIQNFDFSIVQTIVIILSVYYLTNLVQDYGIAPFVIGRVTKLHPLVIFFAVLAGEHTAGILGVLLAIPIAATVKIIYEFLLDKINQTKPT